MFGDRWTLLVIRDLVFGGKRHFMDIMESPEGIASNILAARLKKLDMHGLISRRVDPRSRKQVVYELTDKGLELVPIDPHRHDCLGRETRPKDGSAEELSRANQKGS